jgi:hypothetical protein
MSERLECLVVSNRICDFAGTSEVQRVIDRYLRDIRQRRAELASIRNGILPSCTSHLPGDHPLRPIAERHWRAIRAAVLAERAQPLIAAE